MREPDLGVVVHRQHPCLRSIGCLVYQALLERMRLGWVHFRCRFHSGGWVPFTRRLPTLDAYLTELTALRDQLKTGLSSTAHQPDNEEGPSVSEMAGKIKALKAAHNIEATPQRHRQKHSSAEEPVTARIRRRVEAIPPSNHTTDSDAAPETRASVPSEPPQNTASKSPTTFQERINQERKQKSEGPGPS